MEILFELLFQFVIEVVFELIGELFASAFRRMSPDVRRRVATGLSAVTAAGAGFAWGLHVADVGEAWPRSVWVSTVFAIVTFAMAAVARRRNWQQDPEAAPMWRLVRVDRWSTARWVTFGVISVVLAGSISLGFVAGR